MCNKMRSLRTILFGVFVLNSNGVTFLITVQKTFTISIFSKIYIKNNSYFLLTLFNIVKQCYNVCGKFSLLYRHISLFLSSESI